MHASPQPLHEMMNVSPALLMAALAVLSLISLVLAVFFVVVFCKLFHKMGHHWALGFLSLVPFGSSLILVYMAFSRWPLENELDRLRAAVAGSVPAGPASGVSPASPGSPASPTPPSS